VAGAGAFVFEAGMTIDADGAPRAYHPDGKSGLDFLANAGRPGDWFGVVTDNGRKDGTPVVQGQTDPAPGFFVSPTSLVDASRPARDPRRYVDSSSVPYVALAPQVRSLGVHLGDFTIVLNRRNGKNSPAIFADIGPSDRLGEGSIALAEALGVPPSPKHGGALSGLAYLVFPGSGSAQPRAVAEISSETDRLLSTFGGLDRLRRCLDPESTASAVNEVRSLTSAAASSPRKRCPEHPAECSAHDWNSEQSELRPPMGDPSVSILLNAQVAPRGIPQAPSAPITATGSLTTTSDPTTENQKVFVAAIEGFAQAHGSAALAKYPEIAHWMSA
jgi:hypothetical protein